LRLHRSDGGFKIALDIALPQCENAKSGFVEHDSMLLVTVNVFPKLVLPIVAIGTGRRSLATSGVLMPKTSVDEHYDAITRENDVGSPWQLFDMHAVTKPESVQSSPQQHFRLCILRPNSSHVFRAANRIARQLQHALATR
jgi:hypothetical protein